ncbi:hypothetical protein Q3G72_034596 [Acer saccharum]|nr:hypothetical protein Q3G72_034596 [Acer saccharum]
MGVSQSLTILLESEGYREGHSLVTERKCLEAVELVGVNEIEDEKKIVQKLDEVVIHSKVSLVSIKDGGWNVDLINTNFLPDDAKSILQTPIASGSSPDSMFWHYEANARYSVGSGYYFDRSLSMCPGNSNPNPLREWWKSFWKLNIPQKIKIFFWRACFNWIPTKYNIARRGILTDGNCIVCNTSMETTLHALWDCKKLKHIRNEWSHLKAANAGNHASFLDLVIYWFSVVNKEDKKLFCVLVWKIWGCPNALLHNSPNTGIYEIFCWSKNFLVESLCNAQDKNKKIFDVPHLCSYWIPPVLGKLKMNCVATFDRMRERTGIGVMIRDSDGEVLACCSQRMETNMSTKLANLLAIQKGIQFGVDCGFLLSVIKLDNAVVIDWINNGSHVDSKFGTILMEINKLTDGPQGLLFRYVTKPANKAAQGLSKNALGISADTFWLEEFPSCIDRVIGSEKPG